MGELITVTPKPGSRKFKVVGSGMTQFNKVVGSTDPSAVRSTGEFKGQRFPNSRQIVRPRWSFSKRMWMLSGAKGNSVKLNEIVKDCKLKYEKGDARYPNYIEEADIFDFDDPFFTHSKLKMIAREGEFVLDKSTPKDKILIMAIQASHEFAIKGEDDGGIVSSRVKYVITDKNIDSETKKDDRNKEMEAVKLFSALDLKKKNQIAMAMGLILRESEDTNVVDDLLWDAAHNTTSRAPNGMNMQDYFIAMCNTSTDEIKVRYLIQKARAEGHLKKTKDGWKLFGRDVGLTDMQVYNYFKNPEHQDMIYRLETVVEEDPVPAPEAKTLLDEDPKVDPKLKDEE